jgi:hypothetical protein
MKSKDWIFSGLFCLIAMSSTAWGRGSKNIVCETRILLTSQSEQEFLGETLELKILRESLKKGYTKTIVIKRFPLNGESRLGDLFTESQMQDAQLLMMTAEGNYDGSCHVTLRQVRMINAMAVGAQVTLAEVNAEDCARGVAYAFTSSLEKSLPVCETQIDKSKKKSK